MLFDEVTSALDPQRLVGERLIETLSNRLTIVSPIDLLDRSRYFDAPIVKKGLFQEAAPAVAMAAHSTRGELQGDRHDRSNILRRDPRAHDPVPARSHARRSGARP